jgi:hypothetical protein
MWTDIKTGKHAEGVRRLDGRSCEGKKKLILLNAAKKIGNGRHTDHASH